MLTASELGVQNGEEEEGKELPGYKWDFTRDLIVMDGKHKILSKDSRVACISRHSGWKEIFGSAPNGAIYVLESHGDETPRLEVATAGTVDAPLLLIALSRSDKLAELWGLARDGTLLAGSV